MKKILISIFVFFYFFTIIGITTFGQSCTQTSTISGYDCDNILTQITINCAPANATVTSVSVTVSIGSYCPSWYVVDIYANGVWNYDMCGGTYTVNGVAGLPANGLLFAASSYDNDAVCDYVTINLSVTVNYTTSGGGGAGTCASPIQMVCGTTYSGTLSGTGNWNVYNGCSWNESGAELVYAFTATETGNYTFNTTTNSGDPDFFLMSSCGTSGTNIYGSCWDSDGITVNLIGGVTYYLIVDNYNTSTTASYSISPSCPFNNSNEGCLGSEPFCNSDQYLFPAAVDVESMGSIGCLYSTPNPAWYYMQIDNPGSMTIDISSGADVDFIAWGPFNNINEACASISLTECSNCPNNTESSSYYPYGNIVDCSYDAAHAETCHINNAQGGKIYVLLLTNYSNVSTNISFEQVAGNASTNCGIVAPPIINNGPLCLGQTLNLSVTNPTQGATYSWTGPNGFTSNQMNPTISNVTSVHAGTYSLVITVGSQTSPPVTTTVVIGAPPTAGITNNTGITVLSCPTNQSISLTATGGGTYNWNNSLGTNANV
ncbi:MAG: immunoglobulin domain-containing protein, partial [Bacteroidales bacterium]|nr:immunoglobulin domain-containing protein [Bacteroidales bacterium]